MNKNKARIAYRFDPQERSESTLRASRVPDQEEKVIPPELNQHGCAGQSAEKSIFGFSDSVDELQLVL